MGRLNRRDFLKALGLGGSVGAVEACGWDDNRYYTPIEQYLPYVVKEESVIPGTPTFFATTIGAGPHAHPVLARHREGRVVNVGANASTPWSAGVPTTALLALQRHYSPDRYRGPQERTGDAFAPTTWEAGLARVVSAITGRGAKKIAWLGGYRSGSIVELIRQVAGEDAVFWEPLGYEAEVEAARVLFGTPMIPGYNLSDARYVLSFGAAFLSGHGGARMEGQYAKARNPNVGGFVTRFAHVGPHLDQTAANADDWISVAPGAEADVALAVARLVADKVGTIGALGPWLGSVDVGALSQRSGVGMDVLESIATHLTAAPSVALPGGVAGASTAAVDLAVATYLINLASGASGVTFGSGREYLGPIHGRSRLDALKADLDAGNIAVLFVDDVNPAFTLPKDSGVAEALDKADLLVALASNPDETTALADLVLPTNSPFEDWGDEEVEPGLVLVRQPGMIPLWDTRSVGDVLLQVGRAAGLGAPATPAPVDPAAPEAPVDPAAVVASAPATLGFGPETWRDWLRLRWEQTWYPRFGAGRSFDVFWHETLAAGFVMDPARPSLHPLMPAGSHTFGGPAEFRGAGEFFLHVYPHPIRGDGRWANEPWAQETPDPLTGQTWDAWVEIAPEAAARLGVADNDLVEITTDAGTIRLGVEVFPGTRADTIAVAFGQGHTKLGRYADGVGANVVDLLASAGGAWQSMKASVRPAGGKADLVSTFGGDHLAGRQLAPVVPATALAAVGDAPAAHPGELTGIHHLPRDRRLVESGNLDFYPEPDHPSYRFAMTVDTNACTGCGVCSIACSAENNLPLVGKELIRKGREMNWIRVNRYWEQKPDGTPEARFLPMMCQQCGHAPCESVCPVLATYHSVDGLNAMVYNRCVGTRYCANNCPYQARRFNWHSYVWPEPFHLQLNPDVSVRTMGVMEKCTFCVQRTREIKSAWRDQGFTNKVPSTAMERLPACAEACPSQAITFGNLDEAGAFVAESRKSARSYLALEELATNPAVNYLARASFHVEAPHHGEGHGAEAGHGAAQGESTEPPHGAAAPDAHGNEHGAGAPAGGH